MQYQNNKKQAVIENMNCTPIVRQVCYNTYTKKRGAFLCLKLSILSELAKLLKKSVKDGYEGMGFQQITQ